MLGRVAAFSYASFSSEARGCIVATSVFAYADGVPAEPRHLLRALHESPSDEDQERAKAARPGPGSVYTVFTEELRTVLERAVEIADGPVEPPHLGMALDSGQ